MSETTTKQGVHEETIPQVQSSSSIDRSIIIKYSILLTIFGGAIFVFSIVMSSISSYRSEIYSDTYKSTSNIYGGPLTQKAPTLERVAGDSDLYVVNSMTPVLADRYVNNTYLKSTKGNVEIDADYVKKGLSYQPSYRTKFNAEYILKNSLNEKSIIAFEFPFPSNTDGGEISNTILLVDGKKVEYVKTKLKGDQGSYYDYGNVPEYNGLRWEGEINPGNEIAVQVSYDTVGLSQFTYEGIENPSGSQDFNFDLRINGIRSYDVAKGLAVDNREFGQGYVVLSWAKSDLYSKPVIDVSVGDKINPSTKVSRIYLTMAPLYLTLMIVILYLTDKFGKQTKVFDLFIMTVLFTLYFPFIHYLSSFTIDPTVELFDNFANPINYSMPLFGAFLISWTVVGGLIFYLISRLSSLKFGMKFILPSLILFLGFFPAVVTVPEYSMLLVIVGSIALMAIVIQVRMSLSRD